MDDVNTTTPDTAPDAGSSELTINDLAAVKSIIDVASTRGAFKPNEMVAVGTVYSKIDAFLTAAQAAQKASAANA
jgi:hypothetical protein